MRKKREETAKKTMGGNENNRTGEKRARRKTGKER